APCGSSRETNIPALVVPISAYDNVRTESSSWTRSHSPLPRRVILIEMQAFYGTHGTSIKVTRAQGINQLALNLRPPALARGICTSRYSVASLANSKRVFRSFENSTHGGLSHAS